MVMPALKNLAHQAATIDFRELALRVDVSKHTDKVKLEKEVRKLFEELDKALKQLYGSDQLFQSWIGGAIRGGADLVEGAAIPLASGVDGVVHFVGDTIDGIAHHAGTVANTARGVVTYVGAPLAIGTAATIVADHISFLQGGPALSANYDTPLAIQAALTQSAIHMPTFMACYAFGNATGAVISSSLAERISDIKLTSNKRTNGIVTFAAGALVSIALRYLNNGVAGGLSKISEQVGSILGSATGILGNDPEFLKFFNELADPAAKGVAVAGYIIGLARGLARGIHIEQSAGQNP